MRRVFGDSFQLIPSDTAHLPIEAHGLFVGVGGNVKVVTPSGNEVTFIGVPSGRTLKVRAIRVLETGTTAANIRAFVGRTIIPGLISFVDDPAAGFSPTDIASLEALYEPWDLTSMRIGRNGSGGSPAANSVVGMLLDKSEMGGLSASAFIAAQPELVTNGAFDSDTAWTDLTSGTPPAPATISGGVLNLPRTDAANRANSYQQITLPANQWCLISFTSVSQTIRCSVGSAPGAQNHGFVDAAPGGTATLLVRPTLADPYLTLFCATNATTGQVDNVSVKAVPGNHLIAPSDAARPILRESGGLYYLEFDGVDDYLYGQFESETSDTITVYGALTFATHTGTKYALGLSAAAAPTQSNVNFYSTSTNIRTIVADAGINGLQANFSDGSTYDVPSVFGSSVATDDLRLRINAADGFSADTSGDFGVTDTPDQLYLGASFTGTANAVCDCYGVVIIDGAISTDDRDSLETYLAEKCGVTL